MEKCYNIHFRFLKKSSNVEFFPVTVLDDVLEGRKQPSELSRISIHVNGNLFPTYALNDILVAHPCPATVSRFSFRIKEDRTSSSLVSSRSSGLRISTAAGSTAAILSAGGIPMPISSQDLQYMAREPISPRVAEVPLLRGFVKPEQLMLIDWYTQEGVIYVDGCHVTCPLRYGNTVEDIWNKTWYPKAADHINSEKTWYIVDAADKILGRLASTIAIHIRGKNLVTYTPSVDMGAYVIVVNAEKVAVSGKKRSQKLYRRHSGRPGGMKVETFAQLQERIPERIIEHAVRGMLPKGRLGRRLFTHLKVYKGPDHPHEAQLPIPLPIRDKRIQIDK
ncbi:hypothetical protein ZIOFF_057226 [Zingiber officinale]|uniref:Large ribosomal subunit protein uL13c n=1 Tax=Zingiber officinale TaxID=94328 RepID=A0A8J5F3D0_ZINOF|nr:hypothetical protein ZIOFF_057226 [Zingiber officinale]